MMWSAAVLKLLKKRLPIILLLLLAGTVSHWINNFHNSNSDSNRNGFGSNSIFAAAITPLDPKEYSKYSKQPFDYGKVVIVLARGRSGSSFVCRLIESVEGVSKRIQDGLFGSNEKEIIQVKNASLLLMTQLQHRRSSHTDGSLIGIKWKPYAFTPTFDELFSFISRLSFPVVFAHRNPLDEFISRSKHHRDSSLNSHCTSQQCLQQAALHTKIELDIPRMKIELASIPQQILLLRQRLDSSRARYLEVKYEDLAFGSDEFRVSQLQRIIDFLQLDKRAHMKFFDVDILATNSYNQSAAVSNYEEVAKAVREMSLGDLLHP